jgi:thiamine transporter 2/3
VRGCFLDKDVNVKCDSAHSFSTTEHEMEIKWKEIIQFKWFKRLYILYIFGTILSFRPSAPFFYEFLTTNKNFSDDEVNQEVVPLLYYSTAVQLLPVFLLMEFVKFNPFLIICTLTGIISTCLYIWTDSLTQIQIAQAFCGSMTSAEVAYYVSIYAHGDVKNYQRLTAYVRAGPLVGKLVAAFLGQLFVSQNLLSYKELHYFNLAAFILATIVTIFVPTPPQEQSEKSEEPLPSNFKSIFSNLTRSFPNKYVVKWTLWSIFTVCGYNQITMYVQPLLKTLQDIKGLSTYNGVLEGMYAVFALIGTILGGFAKFDWKFKGDLILSMTSLVQAFMLLFMSQIENVPLNCFFYIVLGFMYHFVMTVLSGEIAKFLNKGSFGLVFGLIALIAAILHSGMVCMLNDKVGFDFEPQDLFMVYGFYHLSISVLFIIVGLTYWFAKHTYQ